MTVLLGNLKQHAKSDIHNRCVNARKSATSRSQSSISAALQKAEHPVKNRLKKVLEEKLRQLRIIFIMVMW